MTALALALGAFLAIVGLTHLLVPGYYLRLVPPWLPWPRAQVYVSGVVEMAVGAGLWLGTTRAVASWAAAALMAVYVASHVDALARSRPDSDRFLERPAGGVARVVVNLAYLAWALAVALSA